MDRLTGLVVELCTNAGIITDATKFATKQQQQQIDTLKMLDARIAQQEATEKEKLISTIS